MTRSGRTTRTYDFVMKSRRELGADFYTRRNQDKTKNRLIRRLEALGYEVELTAAA